MSNKICLVVDDDSSVRRFVKTVLRCDGFETCEAIDGLQALGLIRSLGGVLDLLVSDIQMPIMDGITLASFLGAEFPDIPIVLISGSSEIEELSDACLLVHKPFSPETLLKTVKQAMMQRADRC